MLSPHDFGLVGLALIFVNFAERFGHAGLGQALVQRSELRDDHTHVGFTLSLIAGAFLTLLFYFCAPVISGYFAESDIAPTLRTLSLVFLIDALFVVPDALLQRRLDFKKLTLIENLSYAIGIGGIGIGLAWSGYGVWALVFGQLGTRLVKAVLFLALIPHTSRFYLDRHVVRELIRTGIGFSFGRIFGFLALYADNLIVGRTLGTTSLGIYSRAYQLMTLPATLVGQIADRVLFPAFAKKQAEPEVVLRGLLLLVEALTLASLPLSVFFCLLSPEIIAVLLGPGWDEAVTVLEILSYGIFFRTAYKCGDTVSRSMGRVYAHAWVHALYAAAVVIGAGCGYAWGLSGVAMGVLFAVAINYGAMSHLAIKSVNGSWRTFLSAHWSGVWVSLFFVATGKLLLPFIRHSFAHPIVILALSGALFAVTAVAAWLTMPTRWRQPMQELVIGTLRRRPKVA